MKKQNHNRATPAQHRISPELAEVLHMLSSLESRADQDATPQTKA